MNTRSKWIIETWRLTLVRASLKLGAPAITKVQEKKKREGRGGTWTSTKSMLLTRCAAGQQRRCADAAVPSSSCIRVCVCVCAVPAATFLPVRFVSIVLTLSLFTHTHSLSHCMYVSLSRSLSVLGRPIESGVVPDAAAAAAHAQLKLLNPHKQTKKKKLNFKQFFSFRFKRLFPIGVRSAMRPGSSRRSRRLSWSWIRSSGSPEPKKRLKKTF